MGWLACAVEKEHFDSLPKALMQHSGYCFIRYVFWIFNCVIWVGGCGVLGAGIWMRVAHAGYANLLPHWSFISIDSIVITVGVVTFVTTFFGCCGAWFQQQIFLLIYLVLVILISIVEFGTVTAVFAYHGDIGHSFQIELMKGIQRHYNASEELSGLVDVWDSIQTEFECCGVRSYTDWFLASSSASWPSGTQIPESCCRPAALLSGGSCRTVDPLPEEIFTNGCYSQVRDWFLERLHFVGAGGLLLGFLQLFGMITSILMYCSLRDMAVHGTPYSLYKAYEAASQA